MKVLLKKVGCPLEVVETDKKYFGECVKSFIGKDITVERVYLDGFEFIMGVDEDGLPKELPLNFLMGFNSPHFPVQLIVGDVVFVRNKPCNPYDEEIWDFEVTDVTDSDKEKVEKILDPVVQSHLRSAFRGFYRYDK